MSAIAVEERAAILHVAVSAALQDRGLDERERRRLGQWRDLLGRWDGAMEESSGAAAQRLGRRAAAEFAFDAALATCSADGLRSDDETRFLARLAGALELSHPHIVWRATIADALATMSLASGAALPAERGEEAVMNAARKCAALALLGQPLALLAIVAIELRLLHRLVGEPDRPADGRAARALVLQVGGGLASQVVDVLDAQLADANPDDAGAPARTAARRAFAHAFAIGDLALRPIAPGAVAGADYPGRTAAGESRFAPHVGSIEALAGRIDPLRLPAFVREEPSA